MNGKILKDFNSLLLLALQRKYSDSIKSMASLKKLVELGFDVTRETFASVLIYELYPLGIIGRSVPSIPSLFVKNKNRELPILFIHGIFHNLSAFTWMKQKLALKGFHSFKDINLVTSIHPVPILAEQVSSTVNTLLKEYAVPEVNIIAHSMGGLVARYFIQKLEGDRFVKNLITLGTPHQGTKLSRFSLLPHFRDLDPNSQLIQELSQLPPPKNTRVCSISGNLDVIVRAKEDPWWTGVRHIHLKKVGHAGLLFSKRVTEIISSHFEEGSTEEDSYAVETPRAILANL